MFGLSVPLYLLLYIKNGYAAEVDPTFDQFQSNNFELKPMFMLNHKSELVSGNLELKGFYDKYQLCEVNLKNCIDLNSGVRNYLQKYVNFFLDVSELSDKDGTNSRDVITVDLQITLTPEDVAYLQDFSQKATDLSLFGSLSKIDAILRKVAKRSDRSFLGFCWGFLELAYRFLISSINFIGNNQFLLSFTYSLPVLVAAWLLYGFGTRKSFYTYLFIILNSMTIWDSLNLYRIRLKEAELKLEIMKHKTVPPDCDPANRKWYHGVFEYFTGDKCLEYYNIINKNYSDDVSLLGCFIETYSFYTIEMMFKVFGTCIRVFMGEATGSLPSPVRWVVAGPLLAFITTAVLIFCLILWGKSFRLSFFGAAVEIEDTSTIKETKIVTKSGPSLIANCRPLRILGRSKFFRRSEKALTKENTLAGRASKSELGVSHNEENSKKQD